MRALQTHPNQLVHAHVRLGILSALAAGDTLSFGDLKALLGATDGNLSRHARKLEEAGYIHCVKSFQNRTPRTEFRLTAEGHQALLAYVRQMESVLRLARGQSPVE